MFSAERGPSEIVSGFTPIIRFTPPLSTLLRLNRDELPLMLANERVQLIYKDQAELNGIAMNHVDASPSSLTSKSVAPLNPKQAQTFAAFRTISKHFDHVLYAVSHALYGDVLRYNDLVDALRIHFLGTDRAHNDSVKTKVKLESVLYALCESQNRTVDILVLSPNRDSCSLYTKFTSHVLYEGDSDGFRSSQAPRTLVVLEFDATVGTWSPVGYNIGNHKSLQDATKLAAAPEAAANPPTAEAGAKDDAPPKASAASRFMNALTRGKFPSGAQPVSVLQVECSSDDEGSTLGASSDGPRNFEAIVRDADKIYHTNPYIEMQHGAAGGGPRGDVVAFQQRRPGEAGNDHVTVVSVQASSQQDDPFQHIRYPTLDMMDCGCCDLFVGTASLQYFPSACIRLLVTSFFAAAAGGLGVALLVLWWGDDDGACCAHTSNPSVCWNQSSDVFLNISIDNGVDALCFERMCPADGVLHRNAQHAYLYGQRLGPGQCLWLAIAGALVCFGIAIAVNHFTMRFLALFKAKPRFMYWLSLLHICLAAALCAVCSYLLYMVVDLRRGTNTAVQCHWYDVNSVERGLCNDAAASQCVSVVAVALPNDTTLMFGLAVALVASSGLHFLTSLIPTVPSEDSRASIPHAIPDTANFVPGIYAPDGATQEQIERLQLDMQLRAISGKGNRWDTKGGAWHEGKARPLVFGKKADPASTAAGSLKSRFANAMRNVRMQVATQRALRRASLETDGSTPSLHIADTHVAVHESGDRYMNSDARQLERKLSLTFKPRTNDQAHLSGATLRDVQRISKRVRDKLSADGPPPTAEAWESPVGGRDGRDRSTQPVLDKYGELELQVKTFGHVTVVRDAVLDGIVERLAA
jgi:hypothetical protein